MEKLFIFGIGGTGARVLRSFTMLLASGQEYLNKYDVYPIILDYDQDNGDTRIAVKCIDKYNAIHNIAWRDSRVNRDKENGFFKSNLCHLKDEDDNADGSSFQMLYAPKGKNVFGKYIGYTTLGKDDENNVDTSNTSLLLQSLYNTDPVSDDAELNLKMDVGFKGNPNIGSVVFHNIEGECSEFKSFLENLNDNDRVIVVGSLFGGTGSSGVPEIIRKIRASNRGKRVKVGAVLVMPYFAPESKTNGTIRSDIFNSKTKAAINYYQDSKLIKFDSEGKFVSGGDINTAYFIGDPKPTILPYCDGGVHQVNPANMVELISALAIIHFAGNNDGCYKYGVNQFLIGEGVSVNKLFCEDLSDDWTQSVLKQLTSFTIAMKYVMFRLMKPDSKLKNTSYYSRFTLDKPNNEMREMLSDMKDFWVKYKSWIDEMANKGKDAGKGNSHALNMFSTGDDLEILLADSSKTESDNERSSWGFSIGGGKKKKHNKSVDGQKIDAKINKVVSDYKPNGFTGELVADEELLLMQGLFGASTNPDIIDKVFVKEV